MTDAGAIGWVGLATSLLLVAVALALSWWRGLGLGRGIVVAVARAAGQLLAVGYALGAVMDPDQPVALAWVWLVCMVAFAGWTVGRRAPEVPGLWRLSTVSLTVSTAITTGTVFGLGIFPVQARAIIPVGGMMVGNAMTSTVVAGRRVVEELRDKGGEIEARLALGLPWQEAARPAMRSSMRTALISQVETTRAVGIVFLPGAMTGLILAGVDPVDAVRVQAALMFLILGAVAVNVVVVGVGVTAALFTDDHRLVPLARVADG